VHHFRDNEVYLQTGNDVMVLYPLGARCTVFNDGFWKGDYGFVIKVYRTFSSIIHCFRDNVRNLQTGNDVMMIPLLRGVIIFNDLFWKGFPKFIIMFYIYILAIFNRLRVSRLFHFGWDFPTADEICGVFREYDPTSHNLEKHLLRSLSQTASFELSCV